MGHEQLTINSRLIIFYFHLKEICVLSWLPLNVFLSRIREPEVLEIRPKIAGDSHIVRSRLENEPLRFDYAGAIGSRI